MAHGAAENRAEPPLKFDLNSIFWHPITGHKLIHPLPYPPTPLSTHSLIHPLPYPPTPLSTHSLRTTVMNDLLYAFMGQGSTYIRAKMVDSLAPPSDGGPPSPSSPASSALMFVVEGDLDPSLHEMVEKLLPIW